MDKNKKLEWILRIAVAGEFIGHGVFGLMVKQSWIPYLTSVGIPAETASTIMPIIGALDITLAVLVLIKPLRLALVWMTFWAFSTALIRPIAGEPIWDFLERFANIGAPLALLYLKGFPKSLKELFS
ncbi:hypothetical protein A3F07_03865 [candidate division WWE3 bacterium RIFCSPHIGHO2_12_FULL_38_15]|uniref:DoxX family protein n=1 Tax=candidate division WWE3 bacterium RIFCSPHIGHO2_02_FULL_38_14 TaxID=1802620 RepID=A0A1F4V7P2_UNCKA|nr:MAG: hypothetical protein A2793_02370 [candidate division WWE3 bacterium RIFCSPHIGHO2_01_FULL_38_45]OGC48949.1 MAG: hypothetical protein A3F07_03865 [candidate division WWE3 bacterium RIFCSPHIGHO2_12_FULL_38_15]OGC52492.1 MAG: hypothetical protein A3B64_00210 [candidate division WWE3 bacterium RIFCSPLOWO2_01_FULL_37_24]OGC53255.1 MAG: hypothetical protein A3D91_02460 [candidate division WWE3 bacterium RIFCSPHIGHO2_02_FULL_38_14]